MLYEVITEDINLLNILANQSAVAIEKTEKNFLRNIGIAFKNIGITLLDWRYLP